ncbi:hypothetical protein [Clostridium sp. DJ247]|uniref:hypothetical protein n=1 Tax=Clostridium sp. DJ247 TaxID=2726188 RepID=UPI0016289437|nr:hypothetical protein [Clostridium sp. DJ247]MBC2581634.1 hypothetical protein [Clostridium sp. DJ247]
MPNNPVVAPHELLELHELMNASIVAAKKTKVSMSMVQDQELKSFMQESFNLKKSSLKQMQDFLTSQINIQGQNNNQNQSNAVNGNK